MAGKKKVKAKPKTKARKIELSLSGDFQAVLWMPIIKAQFDLITNPGKKKKAATALWKKLKDRVESHGTGYSGFIPGEVVLLVDDKRHKAGTAKIKADIKKQFKQFKPGPTKAWDGYFVIEGTEGSQLETIKIKGEFEPKKLDAGLIIEELPDGNLIPMVSCSYDGDDFELDNGRSESECYLFTSATGRVDPDFE